MDPATLPGEVEVRCPAVPAVCAALRQARAATVQLRHSQLTYVLLNMTQPHPALIVRTTLPPQVSLINLNDGTCAGMLHPGLKAMTVQSHPEASPGPHDSDVAFEQVRASVLKEGWVDRVKSWGRSAAAACELICGDLVPQRCLKGTVASWHT